MMAISADARTIREESARQFWERVFMDRLGRPVVKLDIESCARQADDALAEWRKRWTGPEAAEEMERVFDGARAWLHERQPKKLGRPRKARSTPDAPRLEGVAQS